MNRQPVLRLATLLWIVGGLLLLVNVWLYASHFSGSSKGKGRIESLGRQVTQEEQRLQELSQELQALNLTQRNQRVRYLNSLIHTRTFPWSALFDDLEEILPFDVYLASVKPSLKLADAPQATVESTRPRRARTAREARARARGETPATPEPEVETVEEDPFSGDRVSLTLQAFARNDEAMLELVDRLYQDPSFRNPDLSRESKSKTGTINFSIRVTYLTPRRNAAPPEEGTVAADLASRYPPAEEMPALRPQGVAVGEGAGEQETAQGSVDPDRPTVWEERSAAMANRRGNERGAERGAQRGSRSYTGRSRDVRRAPPQARGNLPPEEGESSASGASVRRPGDRGSRGQAESRPTARGPSTVSVAPGFVAGGPVSNPANPGAVAQPGSGGGATTRPTGPTTNPTPDPTPGSGRPGSGRPGSGLPGSGRPGSGLPDSNPTGPGEEPETDPGPTRPPASSTPRLQGSFFDRWIPDFLPSAPDAPAAFEREVIG